MEMLTVSQSDTNSSTSRLSALFSFEYSLRWIEMVGGLIGFNTLDVIEQEAAL